MFNPFRNETPADCPGTPANPNASGGSGALRITLGAANEWRGVSALRRGRRALGATFSLAVPGESFFGGVGHGGPTPKQTSREAGEPERARYEPALPVKRT
jgi:hypothetical protein